MIITVIPKVILRYKNQIEFSIEKDLIFFLEKCFKGCQIKVAVNTNKFKNKSKLVILSGGNTISKFSKKVEDLYREKLDNYFFKKSLKYKIPLIGICHGAHYIAMKHKMSFEKDEAHIKRHPIIIKKLKNKINFKSVNSFHKIKIINKRSKNIEQIVSAHDDSIELFTIKKKKIACVMWHPEREKNKIYKQISFFKNIYAIISSSIR